MFTTGVVLLLECKRKPGEIPQKWLCVDYHALNSLLPPVVKAHSKTQVVLFLVPLLKVD